jgi:hypothetical protein
MFLHDVKPPLRSGIKSFHGRADLVHGHKRARTQGVDELV